MHASKSQRAVSDVTSTECGPEMGRWSILRRDRVYWEVVNLCRKNEIVLAKSTDRMSPDLDRRVPIPFDV